MPTYKVEVFWTWDEAFDKFGFGDGDGIVLTSLVANFLQSKGYEAETDSWGMHNTTINYLTAPDGTKIIEANEVVGKPNVEVGYDCPSMYLPTELVALLNEEFGPVSENMARPMPEEEE